MTTAALTPPPQGAPAPKKGTTPFVKITNDQVAMPIAGRGAPRDGTGASPFEWKVLCGLAVLSWQGGKRCFPSNLEIARQIGLTGTDDSQKRQVRIALHGRTYRKLNPETGKRDGELVTIPGLCDPSRGFVEVRQESPTALRELVLTARWLEWGRIRVFGGNAGPGDDKGPASAEAAVSTETPAAAVPTGPVVTPAAAPLAIAGATTAPTNGVPSAPVVTPLPESPEPAATGSAPAIAEETTPAHAGETAPAEQPSPVVAPEMAETVNAPAVGAPIVEPAPAGDVARPADGEPSAEVLAEVLGDHARDTRPNMAEYLANRLRSIQGVRFELGDDGLLKFQVSRGYDALTVPEKTVLRWLKPEIVALLKAEAERSRPTPKAGEVPAAGKFAPRVANPKEVLAMIAGLTAGDPADDSDCRALARRIATDPGFLLNDSDPATSEELYFGLAVQTKRGELAEAVMDGAFRAACGSKIRKRGAMMVDSVKRIKAGLRKPDHEGG